MLTATRSSIGQRHLSASHYNALTQDRGLAHAWVEANCRTASAKEASQRLGYFAKSKGILLEGHGLQIQFRPDKPWKNPGDQKAAKYRSPLGDYDVMLPNHPEDPTYWTDLEALKSKCYQVDGHPCLVITEGFFKALAGCSNSIPTIALLGVEMGLTGAKADIQGKRYLVPTLEKFARAGFGFVIGFDADATTNPSVIKAQIKLGEQLLKFKVPVYSITGNWSMEQGKGMDDFIQNNGADEFKHEVLGKAIAHDDWLKSLERQFSTDNYSRSKCPAADLVATEIAEQYSNVLAFNNEIGCWMRYGADAPGVWSPETDEFIESAISTILDGRGIRGYGSNSYIANIVRKLRHLLFIRKWVEPSPNELLPFRNGVLEVATGNLLEHSPSYRLTWQLPREHSPLAMDWSGIDAFLDHLCANNDAIKDVLLCFCNAVLKGRADLQKFLHLIGLAGSGKGTFARLLTDLIGADNIYSGTLEDWCNNRFETANAYRKRLVVFWDEDKQTGKLGKFLSLTGGDWIRAEEKGKKAFQYRYDGMVVICSNLPIFTGDAAARIQRRVITVPCNNSVSSAQRRNLNTEFQVELSAFTNYVLSIPDARVTQVLMGLANIPECTLEFWDNRMRVDSIAAWVNDWVIYDVNAVTPVGSNKEEGLNGDPRTLYGSYCLHCKQSGTSPKAIKNFSPDLLELCRSVLGWQIERKVTNTGKFIRGLRLRTEDDTDKPTHDFHLMQNVTADVTATDDTSDDSQSLSDKACEPSNDLIVSQKQNSTHLDESRPSPDYVGYVGEENHQPSESSNPDGVNVSLSSLAVVTSAVTPEQSTSFDSEDLHDIANAIESYCDSAETLAQLRECWTPDVVNAACQLLTPAKHAQIEQWVLELNALTAVARSTQQAQHQSTQPVFPAIGSEVGKVVDGKRHEGWRGFIREYVSDDVVKVWWIGFYETNRHGKPLKNSDRTFVEKLSVHKLAELCPFPSLDKKANRR